MLEVRRTTKGPLIYVSRTHKNFLRRLFELEVPEIHGGTVEIKAIAREAGQPQQGRRGEPPGGPRPGRRDGRPARRPRAGGRGRAGRREDRHHPVVGGSGACFVANALSPAQVVGVDIDEEARIASVTVPERMLSLAIGREGQNARLAAKLTGWRIDIRSDQAPPREAGSTDRGGRGARRRTAAIPAGRTTAPGEATVPQTASRRRRRRRGRGEPPRRRGSRGRRSPAKPAVRRTRKRPRPRRLPRSHPPGRGREAAPASASRPPKAAAQAAPKAAAADEPQPRQRPEAATAQRPGSPQRRPSAVAPRRPRR